MLNKALILLNGLPNFVKIQSIKHMALPSSSIKTQILGFFYPNIVQNLMRFFIRFFKVWRDILNYSADNLPKNNGQGTLL